MNDFYQYHFPTGGWREIVTVGGNGILVGGTYQVPLQEGNADMGGGNENANLGGGGGGDRPRGAVPQRAALGGSVAATGFVPTPRDRHAAVVHNSTFYIFGGFDGTSRVNDLYGFHVDRLEWRQVRHHVPNVPANNVGVAGQVAGRRVGFNVDAGGGVGDENINAPVWQNLGQQELLNRRENGIEVDFHQNEPQQPPQQQAGGLQHHPPPSPRHSHSAVVHNDSMYVFGGYDGSYRSDFHQFNFIHSSWRPVFASGRTPRARYRATACVHEDMMVLFGGHDGTRHLSGKGRVIHTELGVNFYSAHFDHVVCSCSLDVHTFDFLTQSWSLLMTDGVPPLPRDSHVSVVYKNSMYVFGGESVSGCTTSLLTRESFS